MATKKCTTCGKMKKMAKGGSAGCPQGYHVEEINGPCIKDAGTFSGPSVKVAGAILGAMGSGMAALGRATSKKVADKKALKKQVDETAKKLTSNVVRKKGGVVKKRK
tara:strand:+ start:283 stop:603 length:321 start_codon:yes stop_codon:yes gene_type:complete